MNKIYKVVWNAARNCYVVGSEFISKTRRGGGYRSNVTTAGARTLLAVCAACGISFYSGGLAVAADNLQTEPTIVIEVQEQKNEAVQPELLYSQLAAASASADALDITMPADVPAAAEDTSEAPAVDVSSQHSIHDENGYYVYNGTKNDTYNSLTKDGLWVGGVDDNTGFHVDNKGHASANGLDVQNQKITGVADGEFKPGSTEAVTAGQLYDAGIVPGKAADGSVAIGNGSTVTSGAWDWDTNTPLPANGVTIGDNAKVNGSVVNGVAIGQGAEVRTDNATAIGQGSRVVSGDGSVALGQGSMVTATDAKSSDPHGVVSVGLTGNKVTEGFTRRIINVADGINDSDAATYGQVKDVDAKLGDLDFSDTHSLKKAENVTDALTKLDTKAYNLSGKIDDFSRSGIMAGGTLDSRNAGTNSIQLGNQARAAGQNSIAFGAGASVTGENTEESILTRAKNNGVAIGYSATAAGFNTTVLGAAAKAQGDNATALGQGTLVTADNSVALGAGSRVTTDDIRDSDTNGVVSVGKSDGERRIINVADGVNDSDAATYGQVKDVQSSVTALDNLAVKYDTADKTSVTFNRDNKAGSVLNNVNDIVMQVETYNPSGKVSGYKSLSFKEAGIIPGTVSGDDNTDSVVIGRDSKSSKKHSVVVGDGARTLGMNATAIGTGASAEMDSSVAIGSGSQVGTPSAVNGTAVGAGSKVTAKNGTAVGQGAFAWGTDSTVLGASARVERNADGSVALGKDSYAKASDILDSDTKGVVSVGKSGNNGFTRRIINVADGVNDSDAATVKQVKAVQGDVDELNELAVTYTDNTKKAVNFNGATLKNVGDIQIGTAQSTFVGSGLVNGKVYDTGAGQWAENGANATHSMAVGSKSSVRGKDSIAVGPEATVNNGNSVVLEQSTAVGSKATVTSSFSTALGANTQATGDYSVAIGAQSRATVANATAIGAYAAAGENSVVVGGGKELAAPVVSRSNGTAMGTYVDIKSDNGTALGYGSQIGWDGKNSVALGADSVANEENVVSVGHTKGQTNGFGGTYEEDLNRRITNVADGKNANDAATVGQISKITGMDSNKGNVVQYDGEDKSVVTFAGTNGTKLTNIADGEFKADSTDAVTAGQLYAAGITPGDTRGNAGSVAMGGGYNNYVLGNNGTAIGYNALANENAVAIGNSAGAGHLNATAVGQNSNAMDEGATALGQHAWAEVKNATAIGFNSDVAFGGDNSVALGANTQVIRQDILETDTNGVVSVGYSGKGFGDDEAFNRRIINVADGINDSDAATFGQVKDVQDSVKALDASAVQYDSVSKSTVTFDGTNGTALKNVSDIVMNTKDFYGKNAQFSFQDAGLLPGDVQSLGNKWNMAIGEGSAVKVEEGTGSKMQMNTVVGNKARITQALVDDEYQDVEKSTALGQGVTVAASNAVGVGQGSNVRGEGGVAVGMQANVSAKSGVAVGKQSKVSSDYSIAIGGSASVGSKSENSVAMGYNASSLAAGGTAIGQGAKVQGSAANGTAIGKGAIVNVNAGNSVALGASSQVQTADIGSDTEYGVVSVGKSGTNGFTRRIVNVADGLNDSDAATVGQLNAMQSAYTDSGIVGGTMDKNTLATGAVAIGKDSNVHGTGSIAIGTGSKVEKYNSVAIGRNAIVKGAGSVALGASSVATEDNVLSLGRNDGSLGLRIVNMKDGINERDAVTVGQMNALALGDRNGSLSLANGATNLADGIDRNTTAIKSLDEQLDDVKVDWGESTQSMKELTEKASAFAAQTQNVDWNALNSVDWNAVNAMAAVPATMNLAIDDAQANEGTGAEKDDDDRSPQTNGSNPGKVDGNLHVSGNTTLDGTLNVKGDATFEGNATFDKGATMKGDLNMSGNKITGLGAGDVSADSTDAVNGSQLFDVQQQVSDNRNAIGALGSRVSDLGEEVDSVGAISAALAGLHPLDYNGTGSKFQISAALGTYDGTQAAAIGGFYHFNRDTLLSIGGSTSFEGDRKTAANIGLTFRVGEGASEAPAVQDTETKQQMEAMKQEIEMLKAELEQLKNKDTEGTNDKN